VSLERKRWKDFLELYDCVWKVGVNMTFEDFKRELNGMHKKKYTKRNIECCIVQFGKNKKMWKMDATTSNTRKISVARLPWKGKKKM
jgi:hypothetical protein